MSQDTAEAEFPWVTFVQALAFASLFSISLIASDSIRANSRSISISELSQHSSAESCWIAISGSVYDITDYLNEHATLHKYSLLPWCGKDATSGWKNKDDKGQPHTRKASIQLKRYKIGELQ